MSFELSVAIKSRCFRKESYGTENADGGDPLDCQIRRV